MPRKRTTAEAKVQLLRLAEELGSVSDACRAAGFSRDSYYRFKRLYENGGACALLVLPRHGPIAKSRITPRIEQAVLELARTHPSYGRIMASKVLHMRGFAISPSGVRLIWLRWGLNTTTERNTLASQIGPYRETRERAMAVPARSSYPAGGSRGAAATHALSDDLMTDDAVVFADLLRARFKSG